MSKELFTTEFGINASTKMLYSYISTASGLAQWMADDVMLDEDKNFNFIWEGEDHKAKMVSHRLNHYVKFEFLPITEEDEKDPSHFEIRLEKSELTESVFIRINDYSDLDDMDELEDLWHGLVDQLKETVGG